MSEKVKLPKDVCDALNNLLKELKPAQVLYYFFRVNDGSLTYDLKALHNVNSENLMRALVLGYEPEMTAEEQIKELFDNPPAFINTVNSHSAYCFGIRDTLKICSIKYDWMDAE